MRRILNISILSLALSPALALAAPKDQVCDGILKAGGNCETGSAQFTGLFGNLATTLIFLVGAVAVIVVIVGGMRYVLSAGDPKTTKEAKDTVFYALIGVVVAMLAFAMVKFVLARL